MNKLNTLLVALVTLSTTLVYANERLVTVQEHYKDTLEKQSQELLSGATNSLSAQVDKSVNTLNRIFDSELSDISKGAANYHIEEPVFDTQDLNHQEFLSRYLQAFLTTHQNGQWLLDQRHALSLQKKAYSKEQRRIDQLDEVQSCTTWVANASLPPSIDYPAYDQVNVSHIPRPDLRTIRALPSGSNDRQANEIESGCMVAATAAGTAIGSAILPGVGTLIGLGVGALVGWITGKSAAAAKVIMRNNREQAIYDSLCAQERAKHWPDIEEARRWVNEHPITAALIKDRAATNCQESERWADWREEDMPKWEVASNQVAERIYQIDQTLERKSGLLAERQNKLAAVRRSLKDIGIKEMSDKIIAPLVERIENAQQKRAVDQFHNEIESELYLCLQQWNKSLEDKHACIEDAQRAVSGGWTQLQEQLQGSKKLTGYVKEYQYKNWLWRLGDYLEILQRRESSDENQENAN